MSNKKKNKQMQKEILIKSLRKPVTIHRACNEKGRIYKLRDNRKDKWKEEEEEEEKTIVGSVT